MWFLTAEVAIVGRELALSLRSLLVERVDEGGSIIASSTNRGSKGAALFVLLTRLSRSGVQAPLGLQGLLNFLRVGELEVANFPWDGGALSNGVKLGDKLGLEAAGLLGVQVASFLRDIDERSDDLIVALFGSLLSDAASTADLNWELLAVGVSNKLAGLLLNVLGGAGRFIESATLLGSLTIADLLEGLVAFLHGLIESLLLEGDLAVLLKVLLANLLLSSGELCDIGVVALLDTLVGALKDGVLLDGLHLLLLFNTAESRLRISLATAEVNSTGDSIAILTASAGLLTTIAPCLRGDFVSSSNCYQSKQDESLEKEQTKLEMISQTNSRTLKSTNELTVQKSFNLTKESLMRVMKNYFKIGLNEQVPIFKTTHSKCFWLCFSNVNE